MALRSLLLVRGEVPDSLRTVARAGADALVLDLAREAHSGSPVRAGVAAVRAAAGRCVELYIRVGGFATDLVDRQLEAAMPGRPDGILLADTIGGQDLSRLGAMLAVHEAEHGFEDGSTRIIATVSSARGVLAAGTLAGVGRRLAGIAWDADALRIDLGAESTRDAVGFYADPYRVARAMTLFAAAAAKVRAIDTAYDGAEPDGLADQCRVARRDGFSAKLALDAAQVPIINAAFAAKPG